MSGRRADEAVGLYERGFSCSQAILAAFGADFGLERDKALRLAAAFGGGMARRGEICGALTGAMMVLGLKYGMTTHDDLPARERTYEKVQRSLAHFASGHGSLLCRDLLGVDISTPAGLQKNKDERISAQRCPGFIRDVASILQELLS